MSLPLPEGVRGHIQQLSEAIGPRGSTTENELKAADYVEAQLASFGLPPNRQRFLSATSAYAPFILCTGAALLGLFFFWLPQPVGAAAAFAVTLVALISVIRELTFRDNPLRWVIPTAFSHNVAATIPASDSQGARHPPILITSHLDSHRTPLLFSSPGWRSLFHSLIPIGLMCIVVLIALFAIGIFSDAHVLRQIALAPGAVVLIVFLLMIQATLSPFTKGANDNASGAAVTLELAKKLAQQPLATRDVIVAFTGCEEVGAYGVEALISHLSLRTLPLASNFPAASVRSDRRLRGAIHLVIDHVGGTAGRDDGPSVIRSEKFLARVECDPGLLAIAEGLIRKHPELHARAQDFDLAYSELTIGAKYGLRILGLMGLTEDGSLPNWHVPNDVIANVNETTLARAIEFAWLLLQAIDAEDAD